MNTIFKNKIHIFLTVTVFAVGALAALALPQAAYAQTAWNATDWTLYDTITIDATQVDDDLTDFPVYVDLADLSSTFWSTTPTSSATVGTDIRVTTNDGSPVELARELVSASSTLQTGELHFKADSISSTTDTIFRVYYNGTTTGDYATNATYGAENVWNSNFLGVWHLQDTVTDARGDYDGTTYGSITYPTGQLGESFRTDASDERFSTTEISVGSDYGISSWINFPIVNNGSWRTLVQRTGGSYHHILVQSDGLLGVFDSGFFSSGYDVDVLSGWHHLATRAIGSNTIFYIDGVAVGTSTTFVSEGISTFGNNSGGAQHFGTFDEMRVASTAPSVAWISAEYTNQSTPNNFYVISHAEPRIFSAANQTFTLGQSTTTISAITITDANDSAEVTAANDIRIAIATNTVNMRFDTTDTTATVSGSGSGKVSSTVSYEGDGSVLVLDVTSNFSTSDSIEVSGLSFVTFAATNTATSALELHLDGGVDTSPVAWDEQTAEINTTIVWDGGGGNSSWETAENWSADVVPTAVYDVVIDTAVTVNIAASTTIHSLTIGSTASVASTLNFSYNAVGGDPLTITNDATIYSGASMTHGENTTAQSYTIKMSVGGDFDLKSGATINTDARGYTGGWYRANGNGPGAGLGGTSNGAGGAYGGDGANADSAGGDAYGSTTIPAQLGSGGGGGGSYVVVGAGGDGGGLAQLVVSGTTTINGTITADGAQGVAESSNGRSGGSGAGGGVYINTTHLAGSGTIGANGAASVDQGLLGNDHGAGGGGRIAIHYTTGTASSLTLQAFGGSNNDYVSYRGGAGTIYIQSGADPYGSVTIDNNNVSTNYAARIGQDTGGISVQNLTIQNQGDLLAPSGTLTITGNYTNNGLFTANSGTTTFAGTTPQTVSGTLTGSSAFNDVVVSNTASTTFSANAAAADITIDTGATLIAPAQLTLTGDYTNNGTFTAGTSLVTLAGTATQTATGTLTGTSAFNNLTVTNTYGDGSTTFGVVFGDDVTTSGTYTMNAGTAAQFTAGATSTFQNVDWAGTSGSPIYLRSTVDASPWFLDIPGSRLNIEYVDVQDSDASNTDTVVASNGTDSGNNTNWDISNNTGQVWNATDWTLYDTITIDATKVDAALTNFPVYVDLADLSANFWETTSSASTSVGADIRVTTDADTPVELPRELVSASSTLQTGELHFKADSISATEDTVFRIYYNGTTTADYFNNATYGAQNVWTNGYAGVWHMEQDPSGGSGAILDSTSNSYNGTSGGTMTSADTVAGKLTGNSIDFDGSDDYIDFGTELDLTGEFYISSWVQAQSDTGAHNDSSVGNNLFIKGGNAGDPPYNKQFTLYDINGDGDTTPVLGWFSESGATNNFVDSTGDFIEFSQWYYVSADFDGSNLTLYKNDTAVSGPTSISDPTPSATDNFRIADGSTLGDYFDGYMDEVRIASTSRSDAWISAEYTNQSTTTDFYTVRAPALAWDGTNWTLYDTITIDADDIDDDLTDFPVYVDLADLSSQFWATTPAAAHSVGDDIRVTTNAETPVEVPRELVAASSTAETGELHFKANSISSTTDTVFRIYYNGTTTQDYVKTATYGAHNVWSNGYAAVFHLNEDPSGEVVDSTVNDENSTPTGTMTSSDLVSGTLGQAVDFDGSDDQFTISVADSSDSTFSYSIWAKPDVAMGGSPFTESTTGTAGCSVTNGVIGGIEGTNAAIELSVGTNGLSVNEHSGGHAPTVSSYSTTISDWAYVTINSKSATDMELYFNATEVDTALNTSKTRSLNASYVGREASCTSDYFNGQLDELRIATSSRTAAWISAEYTNQSSTTDFYVASTEVTVGSTTIANHDATQVSNAFNFQNQTNEALFAFKLVPESGNATVTELILDVSGVKKVVAADFTNIKLLRDYDNDAAYDAGDAEVSTGVMSLTSGFNNNLAGTITFSTDFLSTTTQNYVVVADWDAPDRGSFLTIALTQSGVTSVDEGGTQDMYGTVDSIQHNRAESRGGGGGSAAAIGGAAPAGDGDVGGGTNEGGELIGNNPNFKLPTTNSGSWTNAGNAYDNTDGTYATDNGGATNNFGDHGFAVAGGNTIEGIAVQLEVSGTTAAGDIGVQLSWDGGTTWTTTKTTPTLTTTDAVTTLGGPSDLWGRVWTPSEFSDANFAIRLTGNPSSNTVQVDAIQVRVYHQAGGGGGGGGGAI